MSAYCIECLKPMPPDRKGWEQVCPECERSKKMPEQELKPCPFCGYKNVFCDNDEPERKSVICPKCACAAPLENWNTRMDTPVRTDLNDRLGLIDNMASHHGANSKISECGICSKVIRDILSPPSGWSVEEIGEVISNEFYVFAPLDGEVSYTDLNAWLKTSLAKTLHQKFSPPSLDRERLAEALYCVRWPDEREWNSLPEEAKNNFRKEADIIIKELQGGG